MFQTVNQIKTNCALLVMKHAVGVFSLSTDNITTSSEKHTKKLSCNLS